MLNTTTAQLFLHWQTMLSDIGYPVAGAVVKQAAVL